MSLWKTISQKNKDKYTATGDIKYALKALAADARIPSRPKFKINDVTVGDFFDVLDEIVISGGSIDDPMQKILNKKIAQFLLGALSDVKRELPAFQSPLPKNHLQGFIPELLPFDKASLRSLKQMLDSGNYPTPEISQMVLEVADVPESLKSALSFALGMAFISLVKRQLLNNPILTVLPSELVKTAAPKDFNYRSPRLSDIIEALRIAHGKMLIDYNQAAMGDFMQGSTDFETLFPAGLPQNHQKQLAAAPAQLAVLSAAYLRHYKELQRALHEYCWSNISDVNTRVISNTGEVLTPNIYINPNIEDAGASKAMPSLFSREHKLADLNLNMTMWNGKPYQVRSATLTADDIRTKFFSDREYSDVAADVIDESMESMERARTYTKSQAAPQMIQTIAKLMIKPSIAQATDIFDEFMVFSKDAVDRAVSSDNGLLLAAANQAKQTYGSMTSDADIAGTAFKTKDIDNILIFNDELLYALESSKSHIISKYGNIFADKKIAEMVLTNMFKTYSMPLLPVAMRYIYNAPSAAKLIHPSTISGKDTSKVNDRIGTVSDGFAPIVAGVLSSQQFSDRYIANEDDYKSSVIRTDAISKLRDESLGNTLAPSKLEPILKFLGIDNAGLKARQAEIALAYGSSSQEAMKRKGDAINKTIADIMNKYSDLERQGLTSDLTREHVIVYICNKVLPGIIEEYISDVVSKGFDAKTQDKQEEVNNFIRTNFMSLKGGRGGSLLASNTVYGKLSELYRAIDDKKKKGQDASKLEANPIAAIRVGADLGYRASRAAPALAIMTEFFNKNQKDPSVTDNSWADPERPRPRNWKELGHLTKAFADPIPDTSKSSSGVRRKTRLNIQPGERFSREQIEQQNKDRESAQKGKVVLNTVQSNLRNIVRRLSNNIAGNPVLAIREALSERRKEILSVSPAYEKDIQPYRIDGSVPFDESPFVSENYIPPQVEVDFSISRIDDENAPTIIDDSDENPEISVIVDEVRKQGLSEDILKKFELELKKLPSSYLSEKNRATTTDMILSKIAPGFKRTTVRRDAPSAKSKPPDGQKEPGSSVITSLSKTIFVGDKLAERLVPGPTDDAGRLNSKASELMKYLQMLTEAQAGLRAELSAAANNASAVAKLREVSLLARNYSSQLLKAINKAKTIADKIQSSSDESEFDYIKESLPGSREKIRGFISRMSQMPTYKDTPDVVKRVTLALDSLTNVKDLAEAVSPQALQLFLMELNRRLSLGDKFENLLVEVDKYRVKNTRPPEEKAKRDEDDIESIFDEQSERWESAIKSDQSQAFTGPKT